MHEKLSKSPITYVLGQIQFTNIELMEKYIPELQEAIRQEFPFFKKITIQAVDFRDSQQPMVSAVNQWHFMDKNSESGIMLDGSSISIHTSRYDHFPTFKKQFEHVLVQFNKILKISLCLRLGLRYINLIKSHVATHVQPALLGFHLEKDTYFEQDKFLMRMELSQKSKKGLIRIKSFHVSKENRMLAEQNLFVPPEMSGIADYLSFGHHEKPTGEFVVVDIDHFSEIKENFDVKKIIEDLTDLQDGVYHAFRSAVTPKALTDWK